MDFDAFKNETTETFKKLEQCFRSLYHQIESINKKNPVLMESNIFEYGDEIEEIINNLEMNLEMIVRNKMKCIFFGKTSNGKSATINAILGDDILPSQIGRTTSCFISIEGSPGSSAYLIDGNGQRREINDIHTLADELDETTSNVNSEIRLFWPKSRCGFLQNEIRILDSPGVDFSPRNNGWIENHCRDADVFVYVVDGGSTINQSERIFFQRVKSLLKTPNIIILINKWDLCSRDKSPLDVEMLRNQHRETAQEFLNGDLKLQCDINERLFFVSSTEALECAKLGEPSTDIAEFTEFVRFLQEEMSQKALSTKFKPHVFKGIKYIEKALEIVDKLLYFDKGPSSDMHPSALKLIINDLIKRSFQNIRDTSTTQIEKQYFQLSPALVKGKDADFYDRVSAENSEKVIIKILHDTFKGNVTDLSLQIKNELAKYCRYKMPGAALDYYTPLAFTEYIALFEKRLPGHVCRITNKFKVAAGNQESCKNEGMSVEDHLLTVIKLITNLKLEKMKLKHPDKFVNFKVITEGIKDTLEDKKSKEPKPEVRQVPESLVMSLVTQSLMDFVNESENEIGRSVEETLVLFFANETEICNNLKEFEKTKKALLKIKERLENAKMKLVDQS